MKYLCDPQIIPTVVPMGITDIASYALKCSEFSAWLHVDIADGAFAQNITWPFTNPSQMQEISTLHENARIPDSLSLEAHLMVAEPAQIGESLARSGFRRICGHIEAFASADEAGAALSAWRDAGAEAGVALLIDTPLTAVEAVAGECDFVLLMSIAEIGKQGKQFDDRALVRAEELHAMYPDMMVAIDGGVSEATVEQLVRAGANRMSVGSAIAGHSDPAKAYLQILERAQKGCAPLLLS